MKATHLFLMVLVAGPCWGLIELGIEPVGGYERVQRLAPTAHTKDRLVYGARITAGVLSLRGELEYLRATDTESFTDQDLSTTDTADKAKLGLRSQISFFRLLALYARLGAQATKNRHVETTGGQTTTTDQAITYNPYLGVGLRIGLGSKLNLNGDITAVIKDTSNLSNNEFQAMAGLSVRLP